MPAHVEPRRPAAPASGSHGKAPAQINQSLQGGMDCLFQLVSADGPVGCSDLATQLGMDITRVNRLLGTLACLGIAERTPDRRYIPGPGLHILSAMSLRGSRLLTAALPHLRRLVDESGGLNVALGVLWQRHVCYLFHGGGERPFEAAIAPSCLFPAEQSSIGRVLLSHYSEQDVLNRFPDLPSPDRFIKSLTAVRKCDYAIANDARSIAVAVGCPAIAGLAFSKLTPGADHQHLADLLNVAAAEIASAVREMSNTTGNTDQLSNSLMKSIKQGNV